MFELYGVSRPKLMLRAHAACAGAHCLKGCSDLCCAAGLAVPAYVLLSNDCHFCKPHSLACVKQGVVTVMQTCMLCPFTSFSLSFITARARCLAASCASGWYANNNNHSL
jgi:hypothetical protein